MLVAALRKELLLQWRTRAQFMAVFVFGASALLLFSFAVGPNAEATPVAAPIPQSKLFRSPVTLQGTDFNVIGIEAGTFWQVLKDSVDFYKDFSMAFVKSAVFGATAALVAAYVGYHAEPTIEGTSVATTTLSMMASSTPTA